MLPASITSLCSSQFRSEQDTQGQTVRGRGRVFGLSRRETQGALDTQRRGQAGECGRQDGSKNTDGLGALPMRGMRVGTSRGRRAVRPHQEHPRPSAQRLAPEPSTLPAAPELRGPLTPARWDALGTRSWGITLYVLRRCTGISGGSWEPPGRTTVETSGERLRVNEPTRRGRFIFQQMATNRRHSRCCF